MTLAFRHIAAWEQRLGQWCIYGEERGAQGESNVHAATRLANVADNKVYRYIHIETYDGLNGEAPRNVDDLIILLTGEPDRYFNENRLPLTPCKLVQLNRVYPNG
jgi:hypothetical protein